MIFALSLTVLVGAAFIKLNKSAKKEIATPSNDIKEKDDMTSYGNYYNKEVKKKNDKIVKNEKKIDKNNKEEKIENNEKKKLDDFLEEIKKIRKMDNSCSKDNNCK